MDLNAFLDAHGEQLVSALEKALPPESDATGELRRTIRFDVKKRGLNYSFFLYLKDYYEAVDKGQLPGHNVPIADLVKWIKDKRLVIYNNQLSVKLPKSKLKQISDDLRLANKVAWGIQRKIYRKGTKGTFFYSNTVPGWIDNLRKELGPQIKVQLVDEIKANIQQNLPL